MQIAKRLDATPTEQHQIQQQHVGSELGHAPNRSLGVGGLADDVARERNAQAAEEARLSHLTARQRLGLSIAKVSQADTDEIVRQLVQRAKAGEDKTIHAYARLLDQSFGRSGTEPVADPRPVGERTWEEWS
jgi:hypothetical protein